MSPLELQGRLCRGNTLDVASRTRASAALSDSSLDCGATAVVAGNG